MGNIISTKVWNSLKDTRGIRNYGKKETAYFSYMPIWLARTISLIVSDGRNGQKKREKAEIGIHAVRGGSIVGDHEVILAGSGEVIELRHKAISREVFAVGALKACTFMANVTEAGLYNMDDVLGI